MPSSEPPFPAGLIRERAEVLHRSQCSPNCGHPLGGLFPTDKNWWENGWYGYATADLEAEMRADVSKEDHLVRGQDPDVALALQSLAQRTYQPVEARLILHVRKMPHNHDLCPLCEHHKILDGIIRDARLVRRHVGDGASPPWG